MPRTAPDPYHRLVRRIWWTWVATMLVFAVVAALGGCYVTEVRDLSHKTKQLGDENRHRIKENRDTIAAFCRADASVVVFWQAVRTSTANTLKDPTLSHASRVANVAFVKALTMVIDSFGDVGKTCPHEHERG